MHFDRLLKQDGLIRQWNLAELIGGLDDVNRAIKPLWTVSDHALGVTDLALRSGSCSSSFVVF